MNSIKLNRTSVSLGPGLSETSRRITLKPGVISWRRSLSTSSQFIEFSCLTPRVFQQEKEDWLEGTPIANFLGMSLDQDDLHGHLCRLIISQLANHPVLAYSKQGLALRRLK